MLRTLVIVISFFHLSCLAQDNNAKKIEEIEAKLLQLIRNYKKAFDEETTVEGLKVEIQKYSGELEIIERKIEQIKTERRNDSHQPEEVRYLICLAQQLYAGNFISSERFTNLTIMNIIFNKFNAKLLKQLIKGDIVVRIVRIGNFIIAYAYVKKLDTKKVTVGYSEKKDNKEGRRITQHYSTTYYLQTGAIRVFNITEAHKSNYIYNLNISELVHKDYDPIFGEPWCIDEFPRP